MAKTYANNTGTVTSASIWVDSGTSTNASIYNNGRNPLRIKKPENLFKPKVKVRDLPKRGFWDGVEWKEYTSFVPRKSITGKWIVGRMHKRWRSPSIEFRGPNGIGNHKQYAGRKELFEEKLKGKA